MTRRRFDIVGAACCAALAFPAASAAKSFDPARAPAVSGPLTPYAPLTSCARSSTQSEKDRTCQYFYVRDPATESDPTYDYGVAWVQAKVSAKPGYCIHRADVDLDSSYQAVRSVPVKALKAKHAKHVKGKPAATASGHATTSAGVSEGFPLVPRSLAPLASSSADGTDLLLRWKGPKSEKPGQRLALAGGMEVRWRHDEGLGQGPAVVSGVQQVQAARALFGPRC